jgi:hypothetical protein
MSALLLRPAPIPAIEMTGIECVSPVCFPVIEMAGFRSRSLLRPGGRNGRGCQAQIHPAQIARTNARGLDGCLAADLSSPEAASNRTLAASQCRSERISQPDAFYLAQCNLVLCSVVKLGEVNGNEIDIFRIIWHSVVNIIWHTVPVWTSSPNCRKRLAVIEMFMRLSAICRRIIATDTGVLVLSAMALVALHTATNDQYGFHRDELATIDDARFLSWGYVVYPPITTLFGASMIGLRLFDALAVGIAMVLTGLMAREIGGRRPAQLVAAWAAAIAGPAVSSGYLFQYVSFDYLCWVLAVLGDHSPAEVRRSALVAGVGIRHWLRHDDQVHDGVPGSGHRLRHCSG